MAVLRRERLTSPPAHPPLDEGHCLLPPGDPPPSSPQRLPSNSSLNEPISSSRDPPPPSTTPPGRIPPGSSPFAVPIQQIPAAAAVVLPAGAAAEEEEAVFPCHNPVSLVNLQGPQISLEIANLSSNHNTTRSCSPNSTRSPNRTTSDSINHSSLLLRTLPLHHQRRITLLRTLV